MLKKTTLLSLLVLGVAAVAPQMASSKDRRGEQNEARAQMMAGKVKSIRSIENQILPRMAGSEYIGPEFDPGAQVYRLKFIRDGRVVFVDVDGRTGSILRQTR
ncbi:PepSY domain-containing protein [uncultured Parasphingorhabdus sp.]|uniref:PepSY domain-containing protein n=1 Tax=uncultured Parasphingorhabdus sp. TaxID=2709694 RepID=UPI0030DD3E6A|tara:strand:- start:1883 stop:2191 length:309 start_codon:yes stop_codon:yes gene_type:complete